MSLAQTHTAVTDEPDFPPEVHASGRCPSWRSCSLPLCVGSWSRSWDQRLQTLSSLFLACLGTTDLRLGLRVHRPRKGSGLVEGDLAVPRTGISAGGRSGQVSTAVPWLAVEGRFRVDGDLGVTHRSLFWRQGCKVIRDTDFRTRHIWTPAQIELHVTQSK